MISVASEADPAAAFKELKPRSLVNTDHSIDIALFGRMVAEPNALNVDAACQVSHAIGVGAVEREYDYYTAVDDEKKRSEEADEGAGMIGTIEFASATVYRYATINVGMLRENLGDDAVVDRAIELFVDSFVRSMPTGQHGGRLRRPDRRGAARFRRACRQAFRRVRVQAARPHRS